MTQNDLHDEALETLVNMLYTSEMDYSMSLNVVTDVNGNFCNVNADGVIDNLSILSTETLTLIGEAVQKATSRQGYSLAKTIYETDLRNYSKSREGDVSELTLVLHNAVQFSETFDYIMEAEGRGWDTMMVRINQINRYFESTMRNENIDYLTQADADEIARATATIWGVALISNYPNNLSIDGTITAFLNHPNEAATMFKAGLERKVSDADLLVNLAGTASSLTEGVL